MMREQVCEFLLEIEAVFLRPNQPFTWASGIKSPIYCDNRLTLAYPKVRNFIENGLADLIRKEYPDAECIMGTSTAGIAHAAIISEILKLPMGYVRAKAKDHGRTNLIEGKITKGQKVVVVEDLISTAGSVIEVCDNLKEEGFIVLGIVSIFTYGLLKGIHNLKESGYINHSLANFNTLVDVAIEKNYIQREDEKKLLKFIENPSDESWMNE